MTPKIYRYEVRRNGNFIGSVHAKDFPQAYYLANRTYGAGITVTW